jgi:ribonuclease D
MLTISDTRSLEDFCTRLSKAPYITIDTEFMRETTYWPNLCLVQIASDDEAGAIDACAKDIDLSSLFDLLSDKSILKVFHAARQDMEIFHHLSGKLPQPIFDTQVAAMVCGFGDQVGYAALISKLVGEHIDKSSRFTDWSLRPLSDKQLAYAMGDVTHLRTAYKQLRETLSENERESWLEEEMAILTRTETYEANPREAYKKIKSRSSDRRFLAILRELAAWRDEEAQARNIPRNRILRDESLIEIAHHKPKTASDLARTRGLGHKMAEGERGKKILAAIKKGSNTPSKDCPEPNVKPTLPRNIGPTSDLLKVLLKNQCEQSGVAQKLIASSEDLNLIAAFGAKADVRALHGWRYEVFGQEALSLREGKTALTLKGSALSLVDLSATPAE